MIIVAPLYSPAFIIEVMRPSIRTLVSGTNIIKYIPPLWYALVYYAILLIRRNKANVRHFLQPARASPNPPCRCLVQRPEDRWYCKYYPTGL